MLFVIRAKVAHGPKSRLEQHSALPFWSGRSDVLLLSMSTDLSEYGVLDIATRRDYMRIYYRSLFIAQVTNPQAFVIAI
jgi:hypothetical protein